MKPNFLTRMLAAALRPAVRLVIYRELDARFQRHQYRRCLSGMAEVGRHQFSSLGGEAASTPRSKADRSSVTVAQLIAMLIDASAQRAAAL